MIALTIALGWWMLPTLITIIIGLIMFRPIDRSGPDVFGIGSAL